MLRKPNYYFTVFGGAHEKTHPVDGGVYGHSLSYISGSGISIGDIMLLYCCGTYSKYSDEIPGIGIITKVGKEDFIYYQYLPLCHPINVDWDIMSKHITELADSGKRIWHYQGNFLRQISSSSFRAAIAGRPIDWP